ncbi:MAG: sodium:solute symporter family protein [Clostridiales bacterium]|nr:sodium:solute symporter family protein [Clostridiales bacterium]
MDLHLATIDYLVIILYMIGMLVIGFICSKRVSTTDDYALGGRTLNMPVMIGTSVATCMGASAAFGNMGLVQTNGVISALITLGLWHVGWIVLIVFSKALRRSGAVSLPDFIGKQFGQTSSIIASLVTVIQQISSVGAQSASIGTLCALFGLCTKNTGIVLGGIIILAYTITGGFLAVCVTDVVQAVMLVVCLVIIIPVLSFTMASGPAAAFAAVSWDWSTIDVKDLVALALSYFIAAGAHASYTQRILASKDEKTAFWGSVISDGIGWAAEWIVILTACCIPLVMPELGDWEQFSAAMIGTYFPPVLKGLFIAAILACVMSTADSFLIMAGSTFATDIVKKLNPSISDKTELLISRVTTLVVSILGISFALRGGSIFRIFNYGAAAYGAAIFIPLACGVFWKKAHPIGVNIGMILGCAVTLIWNLSGLNSATGFGGVIIGVALCFIAVIGCTWILPERK